MTSRGSTTLPRDLLILRPLSSLTWVTMIFSLHLGQNEIRFSANFQAVAFKAVSCTSDTCSWLLLILCPLSSLTVTTERNQNGPAGCSMQGSEQ